MLSQADGLTDQREQCVALRRRLEADEIGVFSDSHVRTHFNREL